MSSPSIKKKIYFIFTKRRILYILYYYYIIKKYVMYKHTLTCMYMHIIIHVFKCKICYRLMYSCTFKKRNLDRIIIKYIYIEYLAACTGRTTLPPRKHRLGSLSLHVCNITLFLLYNVSSHTCWFASK